jgi:hypothetical protein
MNARLKCAVRELDCRCNDGFEVRLLWDSLTNSVSVSVKDTRDGESFAVDVAPSDALDAFHHPFAYSDIDHCRRSEPRERLQGRRLRGGADR